MQNFLTKKKIFLAGLTGSALLVIFILVSSTEGCYNSSLCYSIIGSIFTRTLITALLPFLVLFFLSLVTYKMRDEIFSTWMKFAKWWVPFSVAAIIIAPGAIEGFIDVPIKGPVAFFCAVVLLLISLILIIKKSVQLRKGGA